MPDSKKIEAVVFDVDGTLYPNYKMYLTSFAFFLMHPVLAPAFSRVRKKIRGISHIDDFRRMQAELLACEMKIPAEKSAFLIEKYIYGQFIPMFKWIKPYKILDEVLTDFRKEKIRLGIISDFPVKKKLSYLGLDKYWDVVCSADEIGFLKPGPEAFLLMSEKLGIKPEKIIYVGNHYVYDIIGSNNAGMLSAHFSWFRKKGSRADFTFFNYRKLRKFVLDSIKS